MRSKITICLMILMAMAAFGQSTVQFTWTGTGNPNVPACSSTVKTACLSGYTLTDVTTAASPVVISSTIAETALTYSESPLPSVGSHTWNLVVNGFDQSGNAISSAPATVTLSVPAITLNPPTGFTGVP